MTNSHAPMQSQPLVCSARTTGLVIGIASMLALLIMAHHPSMTASTIGDLMVEISDKATINRVVHGSLIALLGLLLFGFAELSLRPTLDPRLARAAWLAYALGTAGMIGAALINGFITTNLAVRYAGADAATLETVRHVLRFGWTANQTAADFGSIAWSISIMLWSAIFMRARANYVLGIAGIAIGMIGVATLLTGTLQLDVHGAMLVLLATVLWNLGVALQLLRGKL